MPGTKMRRFYFLSVHPEFLNGYFQFGVLRQATQKNLIECHSLNLRDFAVDRHGSVDAPPFGGGDGMVMRMEPLVAALEHVRQLNQQRPLRVVATAPQGELWHHRQAKSWAADPSDLCFICGRFAGIDQRFIDHYVDELISLGDFVLSGGELAALAVVDSLVRWLPGSLGHQDSARLDSFSEDLEGHLEHPLYTRPPEFRGISVPSVLLSGHHAEIERWREERRLEVTKLRRPDLLKRAAELSLPSKPNSE